MTRDEKQNAIKWVAWILFLVLAALLIVKSANAQENYVRDCATRSACTLGQAIPWSAPVQTWVFTPISPDTSLRIAIHNNDTANAHTGTITVWITNSTLAQASLINNGDLWVQAAVIENSTANATCIAVAANNATAAPGANGTGTCYSQGMYAAQIAVQYTPVAGAGTSNFDIGVVQCSNNHCNYPGGPQPGADSSAGGTVSSGSSILSQSGTANSDGVNNSLTKPLLCNGSSVVVPCFPPFANMIFNLGASLWQREETVSNTNGSLAGTGLIASGPYLTNGVSTGLWHPASEASATNQSQSVASTGTVLNGIQVITGPAGWTVPVQATTASNCSASVAASATTQHCAIGVTMCFVATAAQTQLFVNLRDGATGAGTVKWNAILADTAGLGTCITQDFSAGPICGTLNTAMTLELSGNTAGTNGCASTLRGYDIK